VHRVFPETLVPGIAIETGSKVLFLVAVGLELVRFVPKTISKQIVEKLSQVATYAHWMQLMLEAKENRTTLSSKPSAFVACIDFARL